MSNEPTQKGINWIGVIVGVALAVGGFYFSKHPPEAIGSMQETLMHQGIPLDLGKTISTIGMFLALFPILNFFYIKPLDDAIYERTSGLERTFSEAEDLRSEMATMKGDYERRLTDTEAAAREQIRAEINKAQELRAQLEADARARADDYLKKAQEEIDMEKNRVMTDLRLHVVDLTLGATEKILGENVDSERNRKLVQEFVDKLEVPA